MKEKPLIVFRNLRLIPAGALAGMGLVAASVPGGNWRDSCEKTPVSWIHGFEKNSAAWLPSTKVFTVLCCSHYRCCVFYLKFEISFWNVSVVVYTYPCSQRCPWISKLESKSPSPRAHGGQAVCLARGQVSHSSPSFTDHFCQTRRPVGSWRSCVWCKWALFLQWQGWGSLGSLWPSRSPVCTTEEAPSTSQPPESHIQTPHTSPPCLGPAAVCGWGCTPDALITVSKFRNLEH